MKLKLLNEFGVPVNLNGVSLIKIMFPYYDGKTLDKSKVDIVDADQAIISVELSDFEIQGLPIGEKQTFWGYLVKGDEAFKFEFKNAMTVLIKDERKVLNP